MLLAMARDGVKKNNRSRVRNAPRREQLHAEIPHQLDGQEWNTKKPPPITDLVDLVQAELASTGHGTALNSIFLTKLKDFELLYKSSIRAYKMGLRKPKEGEPPMDTKRMMELRNAISMSLNFMLKLDSVCGISPVHRNKRNSSTPIEEQAGAGELGDIVNEAFSSKNGV